MKCFHIVAIESNYVCTNTITCMNLINISNIN